MQRGALQIFAKAPVTGTVKTRLIPLLGAAGAAKLHAGMARNTITMAHEVSTCDVQLWCSPDVSHPLFQDAACREGLSLHRQVGDDLGERMAFALCHALERYPWVILIGTDCPALDAAVIDTAIARLEAGDEVVFGPAADGGFYLVGLRHYPCGLFSGMQWGHGRVMLEVTQRLAASGLSCTYIETLHDLDRPEDMELFPHLTELAGN